MSKPITKLQAILRVVMLVTLLALFLLYVFLVAKALAAPPEGADPNSPIAQWFKSLKTYNGSSCCDLSDCRPTDYRIGTEGYEVPWNGTWIKIPEKSVLHRDNPTGRAVWCHNNSQDPPYTMCFVPTNET